MAERIDPAVLLGWLQVSIDELDDPRASSLKAASDAAGYVHRLRGWLYARRADGRFGTLPDVVHGLSYVRCLAEHHLADTVETMLVSTPATWGGEPMTWGGEPVTWPEEQPIWRPLRDLPEWPAAQLLHGRDQSYCSAAEGVSVVATLYEALEALRPTLPDIGN